MAMGHSLTLARYSLLLYLPASPTQCNYRTHLLMYVVLLAVRHLEVIPERHIRTNMLHNPPSLGPRSHQELYRHRPLSILRYLPSVQGCVQSPVCPATSFQAYSVVQRNEVMAQIWESCTALFKTAVMRPR